MMTGKTIEQPRFARGFTLIEVMVAMVILAIATLGALSYQYHAAKQARIAHAQTTATRTAQLLLEDWKSTGGSEDYDPSSLGVGFTSILSIPQAQVTEGTLLGGTVYAIMVNDVPMLIMMNWEDVASDVVAGITLRELAVTVIGGAQEHVGGDINYGEVRSGRTTLDSGISSGLIEPVTMTTYTRLDAAGG